MNKAQLVEEVVKSTGLTKVKAVEAVEAIVGAITNSLKAGDSVTLVGFGSFSVAERAARKGRNPATGKEIKIAAKKAPKFRPGKELKEAVNS